MNIDGLTLSFLVRELREALVGEQVQRVQQLDKHTLLLRFSGHTPTPNLILHVGASPALYLTGTVEDISSEPTGLALFLRKHLEGARCSHIEQLYDDRIVLLTLDKLSLSGDIQSKKIYVELMGRYSNCIITENNQIIESLIHVSPVMSKERHISPKLPYALPPHAERLRVGDFDEETLTSLLAKYAKETVSATIRSLFNGFGNALLTEVLYRSNVTNESPMNTSLAPVLAHALHHVYEEVQHSTTLYEYGPKKCILPLRLQHREEPLRTHTSLSALLEQEQLASSGIHTFQKQLLQQIKKAIKKEEERYIKITNELEEVREAELFKWYGDLLMIYSYLPHLYETEITVENVLMEMEWDVPICDKLNELQQQKTVSIPLDPHLSIVENGQRYYKQFQRLKKRAINGKEQQLASQKLCDYLASLQYALEEPQTKASLLEIREEAEQAGLLHVQKGANHNKKAIPHILSIPIPNGQILIGRNNKQNDYLTHRLANKEDIWFHTLHIQGSHVVLQTEGTPTEEELLLAASYAAYYSKARTHDKVAVDYTAIKYLKKPPASPLGFVIYDHQKTVLVTPKEPTETHLS